MAQTARSQTKTAPLTREMLKVFRKNFGNEIQDKIKSAIGSDNFETEELFEETYNHIVKQAEAGELRISAEGAVEYLTHLFLTEANERASSVVRFPRKMQIEVPEAVEKEITGFEQQISAKKAANESSAAPSAAFNLALKDDESVSFSEILEKKILTPDAVVMKQEILEQRDNISHFIAAKFPHHPNVVESLTNQVMDKAVQYIHAQILPSDISQDIWLLALSQNILKQAKATNSSLSALESKNFVPSEAKPVADMQRPSLRGRAAGQAKALEEVLKSTHPDHREPFILRFSGLSVKEIAERLNIDAKQVSPRIQQVSKTMKEAVSSVDTNSRKLVMDKRLAYVLIPEFKKRGLAWTGTYEAPSKKNKSKGKDPAQKILNLMKDTDGFFQRAPEILSPELYQVLEKRVQGDVSYGGLIDLAHEDDIQAADARLLLVCKALQKNFDDLFFFVTECTNKEALSFEDVESYAQELKGFKTRERQVKKEAKKESKRQIREAKRKEREAEKQAEKERKREAREAKRKEKEAAKQAEKERKRKAREAKRKEKEAAKQAEKERKREAREAKKKAKEEEKERKKQAREAKKNYGKIKIAQRADNKKAFKTRIQEDRAQRIAQRADNEQDPTKTQVTHATLKAFFQAYKAEMLEMLKEKTGCIYDQEEAENLFTQAYRELWKEVDEGWVFVPAEDGFDDIVTMISQKVQWALVDRIAEVRDLKEAFNAVASKYKEPFILRFAGLSTEDIAEKLNIDVKQLAYRIQKAGKALTAVVPDVDTDSRKLVMDPRLALILKPEFEKRNLIDQSASPTEELEQEGEESNAQRSEESEISETFDEASVTPEPEPQNGPVTSTEVWKLYTAKREQLIEGLVAGFSTEKQKMSEAYARKLLKNTYMILHQDVRKNEVTLPGEEERGKEIFVLFFEYANKVLDIKNERSGNTIQNFQELQGPQAHATGS